MHLHPANRGYLNQYISPRAGETKVGQQLLTIDSNDIESSLIALQKNGAKFVIVGIPEDIGPRANLGRGGADKGWDAFLSHFLNLQHNEFIKSEEIILLGHVQCQDLQQQSNKLALNKSVDLTTIRELVAQLDERVSTVIKLVSSLDLTPIVIGGGHNNALPIIQGIVAAKNTPIAAVNLDPHTDFRGLEGRHSGNGFSYAAQNKLLSHYYCLGMNELKNSAENIRQLKLHGFEFTSIQQIVHSRQISFEQAVASAQQYLLASNQPIGIELDVDSIAYMPASAYTNAGFSLADASYYVHQMAQIPATCYLHLAEGAPCQHPSGIDAGFSDVGQGLSTLVSCFIQSKQRATNF